MPILAGACYAIGSIITFRYLQMKARMQFCSAFWSPLGSVAQ
jgi:hypothetical protein